MRRRLACTAAAVAVAIVSLGAGVARALAAAPATPEPSPAPVKASATLSLPGIFVVGHRAVTVPGRRVEVAGVVRPYIPGQRVTVQAFLGHRLVKSEQLAIKPAGRGRSGRFTAALAAPGPGVLVIKVTHPRTARMLGFLVTRGVAELDENVGGGSGGPFVALIQQRLVALHFYLPLSGVYDLQTALAIDAYHRLLGRGTSQGLDAATIDALLGGVGSFRVRDPQDGTHVEGDLGDQLLALINGSRVYRIYPISSGKPSTPTVLGHFRVYIRDPGYLPDGMYYSDFFYGGYAIHGYDPAPDYPASHGCMRLPISDAISVFDWLSYGDVVDVYQ